MNKKIIYKIKVLALFLLLLSLPFEYWDPFGIREFFTITKLAGLLYFIFSFIDYKNSFKLKKLKQPLIILFLIWILLLLQNMFNYWHGAKTSLLDLTFLQNILLFWLISVDLIRRPSIFKNMSLFLVFGVLLAAILISFGIGLENSVDLDLGTYRVYFMGANPNSIGNLVAIAIILTINMLLNWKSYYSKKTFFLLLTLPYLFSLLGLTGSRGALLTTFVGVILLFLFQKASFIKKGFYIILGSTFIGFFLSIVLEMDIVKKRLEDNTKVKTLGGRTDIWDLALDIYYNNPIFGIGYMGYERVVMRTQGVLEDTHNLFLYFMVTGGVVGLGLFLLFLNLLRKSCYLFYKFKNQFILFVLFIVYLLIVSRSGGAINIKITWILAAIIYGMGQSVIYENCNLPKSRF